MEMIEGGVCAAKGFAAGSAHCGIRKSPLKDDLAVIVSDRICEAAAVYTRNKVKAAPLQITKAHLAGGRARAVIANSGNANACAPNGEENAIREARAAAKALGIPEEEVIVASTGVIGMELPIACIEAHAAGIRPEASPEGSAAAAKAIMTTDTGPKSCAVSFTAGGKLCHLGGICKGSGMIHPNMGTMLCFLTTDCAISRDALETALKAVVEKTFNRVTVDGDTSTNDMCVLLANGAAENQTIGISCGDDYAVFFEALRFVCETLAKKIAGDGEGATRLLTCTVTGASDEAKAELLAKSICGSSLVKAAMFGADANWGRVLCAMGYSGAEFDPETVEVLFSSAKGEISVCKKGRGLSFSETLAKEILSEDSVEITARLSEGEAAVSCWGCDLTYDYVKINGDYRT